MQIGFFPATVLAPIAWRSVHACPLCQGRGIHRASLERREYKFGRMRIPLPASGVGLDECTICGLLYKTVVPDALALSRVLRDGAVDEWRPKRGPHPAFSEVAPFSSGSGTDLLDIGAANGDLLRTMAPYFERLSAFDIVAYPDCARVVSGEYIIGSFEDAVEWSGRPYDVVTAFDVFEHFADVQRSLRNVASFLKPGGHLIVETGDWQTAAGSLPEWYYCNLLEHQVFWSRASFEFACAAAGLEVVHFKNVNHKSRRNMSPLKVAAIGTYRTAGTVARIDTLLTRVFGVDPRLLSPPRFQDHLFAVARRT